MLEQILTEYPQIEVVQIQFNYVDYNDPGVQSRACYEVCRRFNKPVIVMEPVNGGNLVNLPDEAKTVFDKLNGGSYASYALRFAAGFPGIMMVLSGMSTMEQMEDNIGFMKDFVPLNTEELEAVKRVQEIFRSMNLIPCTACRYCTDGCPKHISIPDLFADMNAKQIYHDWNADYYYSDVHTSEGRRASDCIKCGKCEKSCPQHLPIRKLLEDVPRCLKRNRKRLKNMNKQEVYDFLKSRKTEFEVTEHAAVYNMAELAAIDIPYPEADAKNLFVRDDKKKNYYLITVKGDKRVNLKDFRAKNGTRPLTFASENDLMDILGLIPGAVTPLGILNDTDRRVSLFLDRSFLDKPGLVGVHPNDNTATVWLKTEDLISIVKDHGNDVTLADF